MTRTGTSIDDLRFEAPGPGFWELDPVHFPRPATKYWIETQPLQFKEGTAEFARSYGMLIGGLEVAYVNGFAYMSVSQPPPEELPARLQRAEEVLRRKFWREQLEE